MSFEDTFNHFTMLLYRRIDAPIKSVIESNNVEIKIPLIKLKRTITELMGESVQLFI
jgi:hypothetical protein